jgi:hypothetical protein
MKLDRAGLDYLLQVAIEIGFKALTVDTHEAGDFHAPTIMIEFQQTREPIGIVGMTDIQAGKIQAGSISSEPAKPVAASFAMGKIKDLKTLDDPDADSTDNL